MNPRGRRADVVLVERGLFESRNKARAAIEAGGVSVNGIRVGKPADPVDPDGVIEAKAAFPWVSRAGLKLERGLDLFETDAFGKTCLDIGASTGGFTQVLLSRGAARVYAVDVGHGQLHASLREDGRVVAMEGVDARALSTDLIDRPPELVVCDASFISLKRVLPNALSMAAPGATLIALIKPQFEAGRANIGKGGIVRDERIHRDVRADIADFIKANGWITFGEAPSPIAGGDGNKEFLIAAKKASI